MAKCTRDPPKVKFYPINNISGLYGRLTYTCPTGGWAEGSLGANTAKLIPADHKKHKPNPNSIQAAIRMQVIIVDAETVGHLSYDPDHLSGPIVACGPNHGLSDINVVAAV